MRTQYNSPSTISAHLSKTPSPAKSGGHQSGTDSNQSTPEIKNTTISHSSSSTLSPVKKEQFEHSTKNIPKSNTTSPSRSTPKKNKGKNNKDRKQDKSPGKTMAQKDVAIVEEKMTALKVLFVLTSLY